MAACGLLPGGGDTYGQTVQTFYRGLAALEAGLLDDARAVWKRCQSSAWRR